MPGYIVFETYEQQVHWFGLRQDSYEELRLDEEGILKSEVLPGLWLHPAAFWSGDMATVFAILQRGLASAEHVAFAESLTLKQK